jgi:hypothetical protein
MIVPSNEEIAKAYDLFLQSEKDRKAIKDAVWGNATLNSEADCIARWLDNRDSREYSTAILNAIATGMYHGLQIAEARKGSVVGRASPHDSDSEVREEQTVVAVDGG